MDLRSTQIKDTYGNLVTIGSTAGTPTTGTLQNGQGANLTSVTVGGTLTATTLAGTLSTAAQSNVTSVGTLTGLSVNGTTALQGAVTINESGADVDFRIESDTNANMVFVDAGQSRVGIGTNAPGAIFGVSKSSTYATENTAGIKITDETADVALLLGADNAVDAGYIQTVQPFTSFSTRDLALQPQGGDVVIGGDTANAKLDVRGSAIFNENGADVDFRVEGDTDANLLFVDASTDRVGIGTSAPAAKLHVEGSAIFNDAGADVDFRVEGDTNTHLIFADASVNKVMIGGSSSGGGGRLEAVGGSIGINGIYGTAGCKTIVGGFDIPANTTLTVTIDLKLTSFRGGFQCHANTYLSSAQGAGQLFFVGGGRFDSTASRADIHVVRNSTPNIDLTFGTPAGGGGFNIVTFTVANADATATGVLFIYLTVFGDSFTADPTITIS